MRADGSRRHLRQGAIRNNGFLFRSVGPKEEDDKGQHWLSNLLHNTKKGGREEDIHLGRSGVFIGQPSRRKQENPFLG